MLQSLKEGRPQSINGRGVKGNEMVTVIINGQSTQIPERVWAAFMDAAAWVVDSGDIYNLLEDKYDRATLQAVRDLKVQLDDYLSSPVSA